MQPAGVNWPGPYMKVAFMPWKGYNFEDAIVISEKVVKEDLFTLSIWEFEIACTWYKTGWEDTHRIFPKCKWRGYKRLDQNGIIRIGAHTWRKVISFGKNHPKGERIRHPEEKLLRAILVIKAGRMRKMLHWKHQGTEGVVIDKNYSSVRRKDKNAKVRKPNWKKLKTHGERGRIYWNCW